MTRNTRLPFNPSTLQPSMENFGELSQFLRGSNADEDCRQLSESMAHMAGHFEAMIAALRASRTRADAAPKLVDLLTVLRAHRNFLLQLGLPWRGMYEYAAYMQALNNFRVLIGQWVQQGGPSSTQLAVTAEGFELIAWRTLGEGTLMIDMYEQLVASERPGGTPSAPDELDEPRVERAMQWWKKLHL